MAEHSAGKRECLWLTKFTNGSRINHRSSTVYHGGACFLGHFTQSLLLLSGQNLLTRTYHARKNRARVSTITVLSKMLEGFKSLCKTEAEWMYFTPHKIWYRKYFTCWSLSLCSNHKKNQQASEIRVPAVQGIGKGKGGRAKGGRAKCVLVFFFPVCSK